MNAKYAVIQENFVVNLIVCAPEQVAEMEAALGATLLEATPLGMEIGDYSQWRGMDAQRGWRAGAFAYWSITRM